MLERISINEHSSIKIKDKLVIYFDPFRIKENLHDADIIFVTHSHFDHYSSEDINKVIKNDSILVFPKSMEKEIVEYIQNYNVILMDPFETKDILGIKVEGIPSYNINKPMHPKDNNWLGYIVTINDQRIYVCGDTDINDDVVKIKCDIALVPVGGTYTMNAIEAAELVNKITPRVAIPTHYGTLVGKVEDGEIFKKNINENIKVIEIIKF